MNCEDVKKFLVQKAKDSKSPVVSLRTLPNQFKKQYPQSSTKVTPKEMTKILDDLDSWNLPIEERIRIAFIFQTKVSAEMEKEIEVLPNLIIGVDENKIIVSIESPALSLDTRKQTRKQTRVENIEYIGGNTKQGPVPQDVVNNINVDNNMPPQRRASQPRRANQNAPVQDRADLRHRLVRLSQLNAGLEVVARGQQPNAQVPDPAPLIAVFDRHIRRDVADRNEESVRAARNNQHVEELPNTQAPIKTEPVDNDIMIVKVPIFPKVSNMARGVAYLADAYKLKDMKERAMRIATLPKSFHTKLETIELDFFVGGTISWAQRMKSTFTENSVPLRQFYTDCKCHMLREVGYEFLEGEKGVLNELDAKISHLEEVYELEEGDKLFISKALIKEYIASFLLKQLEQKTNGI